MEYHHPHIFTYTQDIGNLIRQQYFLFSLYYFGIDDSKRS